MSKSNENWLEERKKIVGASEISTVIRHTMTSEELKEALGKSFNSYFEEHEFATPYELYHTKKENITKDFPYILSDFGHAMEKYAERYLNSFEFITAECKPQEIIKGNEHKLAGFTPDITCRFEQDTNFKDREITKFDCAVVEVKTYNYFTAKKENIEEKGLAWQYILQNQYQLWIQSNLDDKFKWGILLSIIPFDSSFDNDYHKGQAVTHCNNINDDKSFEWLQNHYDITIHVYPLYQSLVPIFKTALDRWQQILDDDIEPSPNFLRDGKIISKLTAKNFEEIKSYCKKTYGIDDGCLNLKDIPNSENIYDAINIYNLKCEELSQLKKEIDSEKAKWKDFFLKTKCLGIDDDRFTLKLSKVGTGFGVKCNFKNTEEIFRGSVGSDKY